MDSAAEVDVESDRETHDDDDDDDNDSVQLSVEDRQSPVGHILSRTGQDKPTESRDDRVSETEPETVKEPASRNHHTPTYDVSITGITSKYL